MLATKFGNANGKVLKNLMFPKTSGYLVAGSASAPPNPGPNMLPIVQTRGMIENALGCSSFQGTISATVVLMIPTFPLPAPARHLATIAQDKERESPNRTLVSIVQTMPAKITGFRPKRSDARPQAIPVTAWLKEKTAEVIPAHLATLFLGTPKLSIIWGKYGNIFDNARGSEKRQIESIRSCCTGSFGCLRDLPIALKFGEIGSGTVLSVLGQVSARHPLCMPSVKIQPFHFCV